MQEKCKKIKRTRTEKTENSRKTTVSKEDKIKEK